MKVLFISDHHIKLGQRKVPVSWAKNRFQQLWDKVVKVATDKGVATIFHGGDIFDDVPSMAELEVYGNMLNAFADFDNILMPGNHEALKKGTSFLEHLQPLTPFPIVSKWMPEEEVLERFSIPNTSILPYTDLKKNIWHKGAKSKILFTHVRGEIPPHVIPEVPLELFDGWETVYAGDLHSHELCQRNIVYPGSPIGTTFRRSEAKGTNGVLIIDTETNEWEFVDLDMPQLIKKTVYSEDEIIPTTPHHTVYELVGAETSMSKVEHSDLVDKKISNVDLVSETVTIVEASAEEELSEYLTQKEGITDPSPYVGLFKDIIL